MHVEMRCLKASFFEELFQGRLILADAHGQFLYYSALEGHSESSRLESLIGEDKHVPGRRLPRGYCRRLRRSMGVSLVLNASD